MYQNVNEKPIQDLMSFGYFKVDARSIPTKENSRLTTAGQYSCHDWIGEKLQSQLQFEDPWASDIAAC
jgi:hypothetical protein